jgi:phosphoglycerate kinase
MGLLEPLPRPHQDDGCEAVEALSGSRAAAERFHLDHKMNKVSIRDLDMKGRRVFIRVDFNVPLDNGKVGDDTRIRETLPTLQLATSRGARLILAAHLGRPKGKVDAKYSLAPVAARLQELLGKPVAFVSDCVGPEAEAKSKSLRDSEVLLLENVRFHPEEEVNDPAFSKQLAALCDGLFVCDAFGSAHRAHASVVGITKFVRQAAAGLLMEKELAYLGKAISNPDRPFISVLGGAKVSDKIEVVQNLMKLADGMLIGGAMAYTFLKAHGLPIGKSLVENDKLDLARDLMMEAAERKFPLLLPVDHVLAQSPTSTETKVTDIANTPDGWMGLDIGPQTVALFSDEIAKARTIVWNGPLGMFEKPAFAQGTLGIARAVAAATRAGATSIVGGGDSVAAVEEAGVASQISHISTGGGASLEFLAGDTLPGVAALTDAAVSSPTAQKES